LTEYLFHLQNDIIYNGKVTLCTTVNAMFVYDWLTTRKT